MIACIISSVASGQFLKESIYTLKLARRGVNIRAGKEVNVLRSIRVGDVMNRDVETVPENMPLGALAQKFSKSKYNSFPVLDGEGRLTGILSLLDYHETAFDENLRELVVAKELATPDVVTVTTEDNLYDALQKITSKDFSILPVVSSQDATQLEGVLTRRDIIGVYDKAVIKKSFLQT
jgi:CIC family chloride channel protein